MATNTNSTNDLIQYFCKILEEEMCGSFEIICHLCLYTIKLKLISFKNGFYCHLLVGCTQHLELLLLLQINNTVDQKFLDYHNKTLN